MLVDVKTVDPTAFDHDAKPLASDTKTFPAPGEPPSISIVPPTVKFPATPTPPLTINAPVDVLVEAVVLLIVVDPVNVVAPVTPSVPAITVLPVAAATVNLFVLTATSPVTPKVLAKEVAPVTPNVPPTVSLFVTLKLVKVDVPAIKVDDKVVAPVTANVLPNVVAPVTDKVEENVPAAALKLPVKLSDVPVAAPMTGVTKVGVLANTKAPVPIPSVTADFKLALVGVAKKVATPVPNPLTPVAIGKPVPFVKVTAVGVPKLGVTSVGLVDKTKLPEPVELVTPVPPCATSMVVALQVPMVIVPTDARFASEVNVEFEVAVIFPAVVAVVAFPVVFWFKVGIAL